MFVFLSVIPEKVEISIFILASSFNKVDLNVHKILTAENSSLDTVYPLKTLIQNMHFWILSMLV